MSYGMNNSSAGSAPTGTNPGQTNTGSMKPFKEKTPSGYSKSRLQQFTPEMLQLFQQLFSHVGPESYLSKLASGDQSMFAEIEAPALKQFSGLQGNIASRFSGMGMGGRKSSGFQNTMNQAASDFAQQLQSQRQGLQRQAIQDLSGMSQMLLGQKPYETSLAEKPTPFWQDLVLAGVNAAGKVGSAAVGAPG